MTVNTWCLLGLTAFAIWYALLFHERQPTIREMRTWPELRVRP